METLARIEKHVRLNQLIPPGGEVTCLVSGGADSTCLWHALGALGYRVAALHVNHGLRGGESDEDARFCRELMGAEVVELPPAGTEAELRDLRYAVATDRLRATGHTASDQVETVLYRLATSGTTRGIKVRREDGVVRPLLTLWREETEAYCRAAGLPWRTDSTNPDTVRGLIRAELIPVLRRLHPAAEANVLRAADGRRPLARARGAARLAGRLEAARPRRRRAGGARVRPPLAQPEPGRARRRGGVGALADRLRAPRLSGTVLATGRPACRTLKKIQDVFVDAKIPVPSARPGRSSSAARTSWPCPGSSRRPG